MTKKPLSPAPPSEALLQLESNRYLAKFKASLCKRWSITRMETLYEVFDLAAFLWALERNDESLSVAASVAVSIPTPPPLSGRGFNYNLWCPTTYSHALLVHLGTGTWREQAEASRATLLRDAGIARNNPDYIADCIADAHQLAMAPVGQKSIKWECQGLSRALGRLVLYSELAKAGDPLFKRHLKDIADLMPHLLSKLRTQLQSVQ